MLNARLKIACEVKGLWYILAKIPWPCNHPQDAQHSIADWMAYDNTYNPSSILRLFFSRMFADPAAKPAMTAIATGASQIKLVNTNLMPMTKKSLTVFAHTVIANAKAS